MAATMLESFQYQLKNCSQEEILIKRDQHLHGKSSHLIFFPSLHHLPTPTTCHMTSTLVMRGSWGNGTQEAPDMAVYDSLLALRLWDPATALLRFVLEHVLCFLVYMGTSVTNAHWHASACSIKVY